MIMIENIQINASATPASGSAGPASPVRDPLFPVEEMDRRLRDIVLKGHLPQTERAIDYAAEKHAGQYRKKSAFSDGRVPYIIHPYVMTCHAYALGIRDDDVLAAALLHDVCEDCGVAPEELPFSDAVREAVRLLTKTGAESTGKYYEAIAGKPPAAIVKVLDRCNNVSTMALSFSGEKLVEYIDETETYVLPLIAHVKENYRQYSDVIFILEYHILSVTETIRAALMRGVSGRRFC